MIIKKISTMKLNDDVIRQVKYSNTAKARLMYEFDVSLQTSLRWLENEPDGDLTKVKAIRLLAEELKVPEETILTE